MSRLLDRLFPGRVRRRCHRLMAPFRAGLAAAKPADFVPAGEQP